MNKQLLIGQQEFITRDANDLDDFLYEVNTQYSNKQSMKLFDHLDFVFIDGDCNSNLPWAPKSTKIALLFKMCKKTNKVLFAASLGLQFLVYYCATSFADISIINPKGNRLEQIHEIPESRIMQMSRTDMFLDSCNGDYYTFSKETKNWTPAGNTGLHHVQTLETYGTQAEGFISKTKTHKQIGGASSRTGGQQTTLNSNGSNMYKAKLTEQVCYIDKHYMYHYTLLGLPFQFKVTNKNQWDPHPTNITNIDEVLKNYMILAESERGPQIIEHRNTIAVQFNISTKYAETVLVLQNFVKNRILEVQKVERLHITLDEANLRHRQVIFRKVSDKKQITPGIKNNGSQTKDENNEGDGDYFTKNFTHSGMSYSHRRKFVVVDNNAINKKVISLLSPKSVGTNSAQSSKTNKQINGQGNQTERNTSGHNVNYMDIMASLKKSESNGRFNFGNQQSDVIFGGGSVTDRAQYSSNQRASTTSVMGKRTNSIDNWQINNVFQEQLINDSKNNRGFSKKDIREILHPNLNKDYLPKGRFFIAGFKSFNNIYKNPQSVIKLDNEAIAEYHIQKENDMLFADERQRNSHGTHFYNRHKEFKKLEGSMPNVEVPLIRNASPYISQMELERKEFLDGKNKWVSQKNFKTNFGKATIAKGSDFIPNYVTRDPSPCPILHNFRDLEPSSKINRPPFILWN